MGEINVSNPLSRMDFIIQSYVADKQFMGSVLVSKNGQILLDKGYGHANLEWMIPNSPTTRFRIGSLTKQFTAAAILLLEEQGKLKISDHIKQYIADAPEAWKDITLFHLLTHTSGIPNYTSFPDFPLVASSSNPLAALEQLMLFRDKKLDFMPGSKHDYCNSGYVILGYIIETISRVTYQDFIKTNIFEPLGMKDSGYDNHSDIIQYRASGYEITPDGRVNAGYLNTSIPYAAGSLYSTTHDLFLWQQKLFSGEIISLESLEKMLTPYRDDYGFGVYIQSIEGHKLIWHAGGINGFKTAMIYCLDDKLILIVLCNLIGVESVAQALAFKLEGIVHARGSQDI
jgi:CubicO group peptidase (beta-lactamase class C family)